MGDKKCLLLIGSPRGLKSSSYKTGNYLLQKMIDKGYSGETFKMKSLYNPDPEKLSLFFQYIEESELIILSCPLYVDSIPSFVIKGMELIAERYQGHDTGFTGDRKHKFLAIVNCGFPESGQIDTAMRIMKRFAEEVNFHWSGGIKIGGGAAIGGQELEGNKGILSTLVKSLDQTVDGLTEDGEFSNDISLSLAPKWMYTTILNVSWWFAARKNKANKKLYDKPYQK